MRETSNRRDCRQFGSNEIRRISNSESHSTFLPFFGALQEEEEEEEEVG